MALRSGLGASQWDFRVSFGWKHETLMGQGGIVMEANAVQDVGRGCTNRQAVKQKEGMAEKWTERKATRTK